MLVISIRFLGGAYYATPWGKHVNEGVPEWPPSGWRVLRAIIASWKNMNRAIPDDVVWPILQKLTTQPPEYYLPDASISHTRHYIPTNKKPTLIMNTFVTTGDRPVLIIWKGITLNKDEFDTLKVILGTLHYLGRAESRCVATISTITNVKPNCVSFDCNDQLSIDHNLVSVLTPIKNVEFVDILNQPSSKKTYNLKSITVTTGQLHEKNYQYPPGAKLLYYTLPKNCFEPEITHSTNTSQMSSITLVRYAVAGAVCPSISDTMRVADTARSACMSRYGKHKNNNVSPTFSGKDGDGKPLVDHVHAFYLPTYETQNKIIDHLTIIAKNGFNAHELNV
ncbi:MAG: type I-U CRISPR-associated protein Cas5/Cas6, partial [Cenarchaeum sp. SB0667_bin_13]|nr:type I-U CRISPR-associated protein Cas5/Cas6 [Cenarchaeum sp. SB0667_bin_13]